MKSIASCSASRSRRIADGARTALRRGARFAKSREHRDRRLDDARRAPAHPDRSNSAPCPRIDVTGAGRRDHRAGDAFDPRHRDDCRVAIERIDDVECGAQFLVGGRLVVGSFGAGRDLDDADLGRGLDPAGRDDLAGRVDDRRARRHLRRPRRRRRSFRRESGPSRARWRARTPATPARW